MTKPERDSEMIACEKFWYDRWEKYHNWYVKRNCVRKKDLPSEEEIEAVCKWGFERHPGVSPKEIAQEISKLIRRKKCIKLLKF